METPCVLIVDDDAAVSRLCARILAGRACEVRVAAGMDEAIRLLIERHVVFVLTDVEMPGRDGWAARPASERAPRASCRGWSGWPV